MFRKTFDRYEGAICLAIVVAILSLGTALATSVLWYCHWLYTGQDRWRDLRAHHNALDYGHARDGRGLTLWGCNRQVEGKYHCEGWLMGGELRFERYEWDCDDVGCILKEAR